MVTETERIVKQLRSQWDGRTWHGANLKMVLEGISWQKAFAKPANLNHNIYEYVMHMLCWRRFVLEYLLGNHTYSVELNSETDWVTSYEQNEAVWQEALADLEASQTALLNASEKLNDEMLNDLVPGKKFSWYVLLHGMIHHDIYHSAQISLLKK